MNLATTYYVGVTCGPSRRLLFAAMAVALPLLGFTSSERLLAAQAAIVWEQLEPGFEHARPH
jgi:hypothetical protein